MVTSPVTIPPKPPPIIHGIAASGVGECARPHAHADVITTQSSSRPVLLTVPCKLIASPPTAISPRNAFSFRPGLEVRNELAMRNFLVSYTYSLYPRKLRRKSRAQPN